MGQGHERRALAAAAGEEHGDGLSRRLLRGLGDPHGHVRHEVAAERWRAPGHRTVALHRGPVEDLLARRWRAVWEIGHRIAVVHGITAPQHTGLEGFTTPVLHVSIPTGAAPVAPRAWPPTRSRSGRWTSPSGRGRRGPGPT